MNGDWPPLILLKTEPIKAHLA